MLRSCLLCLLLALAPAGAAAQLVVFDNSHDTPWGPMYDDFKAQLVAWGYTVEARTTPLEDNGDADVLVILPGDAYTNEGQIYSEQEAAWIMDYVDGGGGLLAAVCLNGTYLMRIQEIMDDFGISSTGFMASPVHYDQFEAHPLFAGVTALGDDVSQTCALAAVAPSVAVGGDGANDMIAVYENDGGPGAAVWTSHYYMMDTEGLGDHDNLVFLENAFSWLAHGGVGDEDFTWGEVKALYD